MFDLTKEILANLKNAIMVDFQPVPIGPNISYVCSSCVGTCKNGCTSSCKGSCKNGCTRSCKGNSR